MPDHYHHAGSEDVHVTKRVSATDVTGDPRWAAVRARDASADGEFFYSVSTTGVYCRPSCASRPARPEHVAFHPSTATAERAGFRPCKRCRPDQPPLAERRAALVTELCRLIERSEDVVTLDSLARHVRLSAYHVHRLFKAATGVTPNAYAAAFRAKRVRVELGTRATVTEAIYGAGYNSSGRFYETSNAVLGMTPTAFRNGGTNLTIRFALGQCSLGSILVAATDRGVCAILLGDDTQALTHDLERRFPRASIVRGDGTFAKLVGNVVRIVEAPGATVALPLDIVGTAFQQRVWQALRSIPAGTTTSYAELARTIDAPKAARAVAAACAANPIAVVIPCHRVVRQDGDVSGYRWGVERKRALLAREARMSK
jgi:AraC family transcriptional regulator, regulatory protein of adaptative response / methylated-DNA-[protein]-cysteine methyltransferase